MARAAYSAPSSAIRTARSIEYEAFARVTRQLRAATVGPEAGFQPLVLALNDNRRLWTVLASDVAEPDNELPKELRAKLYYLAEFTTEHTRKVLAGTAEAGVLIDINMAVMRGLRREEGSE